MPSLQRRKLSRRSSRSVALEYSRYSDPTLDSYLTAAAEATTYEEQNENFGKALDIINNMALWGIIYTYGPIYAMNANLNAEIGANLYFTEMSWNG